MALHGLEAAPTINDRTLSTFARGELHFAGERGTFLEAPLLEYVNDVADARFGMSACPANGLKTTGIQVVVRVSRRARHPVLTVLSLSGYGELVRAAPVARLRQSYPPQRRPQAHSA